MSESEGIKQKRPYKRVAKTLDPCGELHNPGHWPYLAVCKYMGSHPNKPHVDVHGNSWYTEGYEDAQR